MNAYGALRALSASLTLCVAAACASSSDGEAASPGTTTSSDGALSTSSVSTTATSGATSTVTTTVASTSTSSTVTSGSATTSGAGGAGNASLTTASGSGAGGAVSSTTGDGGSSNNSGELGNATMMGSGSTTEQYETALVSRNDEPYVFITNGWGPGFQSHSISWEGTSFVIESMSGSSGANGEPASYPTVFCGRYSVMQVPDCGLPASIDSITSLRTGWRWAPNGNQGEYNAAYDIWVGSNNRLQGYLMVWLRDPPSYRPAGSLNMSHQGITVENVPGVWNIWDGTVNGLPIINWVRAEGEDSYEIEFDVMDFVRDAAARGLDVPGDSINAVAVGFEIWEGPIDGLESQDFYVQVN